MGRRLLERFLRRLFVLSRGGIFVCGPFLVVFVFLTGNLMFPMMFVAVFFLLIGTGPSNAALVNSVNAGIRSTALAVNLVIIHLLGDAFSPTLIGAISDRTSLQTGFWATFVAAGISGALFIYGARFAPRLRAKEDRTLAVQS